jgi:uncharacterized protein YggE
MGSPSNVPRVVGYRATQQTTAGLAEPSQFGDIVTPDVGEASARIEGPWWRVLPENPGWTDACRLAAEDASRRAGAYADTLGLRLGSIVEVAESMTRPHGGEMLGKMPPDRAMAAAGFETELSPGWQVVTATVDVTFDVLPA